MDLGGRGCSETKANVLTRVTDREILNWIQKHSNSAPILMVMGGHNKNQGYLNTVEIVSGQDNPPCANNAPDIDGGIVRFEGTMTLSSVKPFNSKSNRQRTKIYY